MEHENLNTPQNQPLQQTAVSGSSIRQTALSWWDDLELYEREKIEREFGYYGHDIGTTEDDVIYFYTETFKNCH